MEPLKMEFMKRQEIVEISYVKFISKIIIDAGGRLKFLRLRALLSKFGHCVGASIEITPSYLTEFLKKHNALFSIDTDGFVTLQRSEETEEKKQNRYIPKTRLTGLYHPDCSEGSGKVERISVNHGYIIDDIDPEKIIHFQTIHVCKAEKVSSLTDILNPGDLVEYRAFRNINLYSLVHWKATQVWIRDSNKCILPKESSSPHIVRNILGKIYPHSNGAVIKFGENDTELASADSCLFFYNNEEIFDISWRFSDAETINFDAVKIESAPGWRALLGWVGDRPNLATSFDKKEASISLSKYKSLVNIDEPAEFEDSSITYQLKNTLEMEKSHKISNETKPNFFNKVLRLFNNSDDELSDDSEVITDMKTVKKQSDIVFNDKCDRESKKTLSTFKSVANAPDRVNQGNKKASGLRKKPSFIEYFSEIDGVIKKVYCKHAELESDSLKMPTTFFLHDFYENGLPVCSQICDLKQVLLEGHVIKMNCIEIYDDYGSYWYKVTVAWRGKKPIVKEITPYEFICQNSLDVSLREDLSEAKTDRHEGLCLSTDIIQNPVLKDDSSTFGNQMSLEEDRKMTAKPTETDCLQLEKEISNMLSDFQNLEVEISVDSDKLITTEKVQAEPQRETPSFSDKSCQTIITGDIVSKSIFPFE